MNNVYHSTKFILSNYKKNSKEMITQCYSLKIVNPHSLTTPIIKTNVISYNKFLFGKWYFDTAFFLTSVWHSDVACAVSRDNERENLVLFGIPPLRHMCVFQNYKQRTNYLNWANHLVFSSLRHVCVPKLHTVNHLFELS